MRRGSHRFLHLMGTFCIYKHSDPFGLRNIVRICSRLFATNKFVFAFKFFQQTIVEEMGILLTRNLNLGKHSDYVQNRATVMDSIAMEQIYSDMG